MEIPGKLSFIKIHVNLLFKNKEMNYIFPKTGSHTNNISPS